MYHETKPVVLKVTRFPCYVPILMTVLIVTINRVRYIAVSTLNIVGRHRR